MENPIAAELRAPPRRLCAAAFALATLSASATALGQTGDPPERQLNLCGSRESTVFRRAVAGQWRETLPSGAEVETLASADVDGDGVGDVILSVSLNCCPAGDCPMHALVVAFQRARDRWEVHIATPLESPSRQHAAAVSLGGERFVFHSMVQEANEDMGPISAFRVQPGPSLIAVGIEETDGTRGLRQVRVGRDGRATIPCAAGRCELRWNAETRQVDLAPAGRGSRRRRHR